VSVVLIRARVREADPKLVRGRDRGIDLRAGAHRLRRLGAGFSAVYTRPSYQDSAAAITRSRWRSLPDLTMDAQGGTSGAAPLLAGVLALATQLNHGLERRPDQRRALPRARTGRAQGRHRSSAQHLDRGTTVDIFTTREIRRAADPGGGDGVTRRGRCRSTVGWRCLGVAAEAVRIRRERMAAATAALAAQERVRVGAQRLGIARELHDVVGHNISLINLQAGVGLDLFETQPDRGTPGAGGGPAGVQRGAR